MNKIVYLLIGVISFFSIVLCVDAKEVNINANNAVMYNLNDNKTIFEKNKNDKVYIASLTKIMTVLVAIENIEDINDKVTITNKMLEGTSGYAVVGLEVGDEVTYEDLLNAAILKSAADAVNAITISVAGDEDKFVNLMNNKVSELKLKNTRFNNSIGKDSKNNYSTANDVAKTTIYALKSDTFKKIWNTKEYKFNNKEIKHSIYNKIDKLSNKEFDTNNITGAKLGYTDKAKYCLVSTAKIDDVEYLIVTIDNEEDKDYTAEDAVILYNYFSSNYSYKTIIGVGKKITTIKIKNSPKKLDILQTLPVNKYLSNDIIVDKLEYEYVGKTTIKKNTPVGTELGIIKVKYEGKIIYKEDVKLNKAIGFVFSYYYFIHIGIFIMLCFLIIKIKKKVDKY